MALTSPEVDLKLVPPSVALVPGYIEALKAGPFSHMALAGFGDEPVEVVATDAAGYMRRLTDERPREIITPNRQVFVLQQHLIRWAINPAGSFVGAASLRLDRENPLIDLYCGNVGLGVRRDLQGRGYGTMIWRLVFEIFAERHFSSITASANIDNVPSIRSIKKVGGTMTGRNDIFGYGEAFVFRIPVPAG
jgi:predicted acetyltransferase